ncbi:MAG: response regulator [Sedimentisphaeraceae bacterium JB056]
MNSYDPINLLLVEDNPGDQKLFKTSLKLQNISNTLKVTESGEHALDHLDTIVSSSGTYKKPDIILLDLNMPGIGGKEFLKRVKSDSRLRSIPVIVLTTSDCEKDIHDCYDLQAAGFIKKPVSLDGFLNVIDILQQYWFKVCKLHTRIGY